MLFVIENQIVAVKLTSYYEGNLKLCSYIVILKHSFTTTYQITSMWKVWKLSIQ